MSECKYDILVQCADLQTHRSEVDRDERCVSDEVAIGGKESTREIEALLNIGADGRLLKRATHRLCDAHEAVREERQQDRVRC